MLEKKMKVSAAVFQIYGTRGGDNAKIITSEDSSNIEHSWVANKIDAMSQPVYDQNMSAITKELLDSRLETIETRMDGRIASMEAKIDAKFAGLDSRFSEVRIEMHKNTADMIKWMIITAVTLGVAAITVMTFVLNNAVPKSEKQIQQPAPIIIQVPAPQVQLAVPPAQQSVVEKKCGKQIN